MDTNLFLVDGAPQTMRVSQYTITCITQARAWHRHIPLLWNLLCMYMCTPTLVVTTLCTSQLGSTYIYSLHAGCVYLAAWMVGKQQLISHQVNNKFKCMLEWEGKCLGYILNHMAEYNYNQRTVNIEELFINYESSAILPDTTSHRIQSTSLLYLLS